MPPRPIYLPFWTFDVAGSARPIHAPVAPAPGVPPEAAAPERYPIAWDDLLVPASTSLPAALLEALRYDTRAPVPYAPDLLAAWPAEIYRVPLAEASLRAHERAYRYLQGLAANDEGLRGLDPNAIFILSYKLVLLPVWVTEYQVEATRYPIVVNGQSGAVAGARPRNRWQRAWDRLAPSEP